MPTLRYRSLVVGALCLAGLASSPAVRAEKNDRARPMTLESDKPCTVDLVRQTSVCSGNVVLSQGTLMIRAERLELRETPDGYRQAVALGAEGRQASYRQKRDGADETVEGTAERIEYDSRLGTLRFIAQAQVRRMRGAVPADEIHGALIVWDSVAELFSVEGGAANAANPGGRVRAVLSPREPEPVPAAASTPPLKSTPALGERR